MTYIITETRKKGDLLRATHKHYDGISITGESKSIINPGNNITISNFNPFGKNPSYLGIHKDYIAVMAITNWLIGEGYGNTYLKISNFRLTEKLSENKIKVVTPNQVQAQISTFLQKYYTNFRL